MPTRRELNEMYADSSRLKVVEAEVVALKSERKELRAKLKQQMGWTPPPLITVPANPTGEISNCRIELVTAIHTLASHYENTLCLFRDDEEAHRVAKGDIAHARKVAEKWNWNGTAQEQAQPAQQEPVTWKFPLFPPQGFIDYIAANYSGEVIFSDPEWHAKRLWNSALRNAAPVQAVVKDSLTTQERKPMTHEQRLDMHAAFECHKSKWNAQSILIDMVEKFHGIGEKS